MSDPIDLSIVMPCLNEAETLADCIEKAHVGIERCGVRGEIVIADNGSEDNSVQIAGRVGARVALLIWALFTIAMLQVIWTHFHYAERASLLNLDK